MTDKQIIIDGIDVSGCKLYRDDNGVIAPDGTAERTELCFLTNDYCGNSTNCYYKQIKRKEQECFQLSNVYHCLVKIANNRLDKIEDLQQQLDQLETKNEELKRRITEIFACLIKANKANKIVDTIWVDNITTLWDYIALTLGIEGDQVQIEKQILQKISKCEV